MSNEKYENSRDALIFLAALGVAIVVYSGLSPWGDEMTRWQFIFASFALGSGLWAQAKKMAEWLSSLLMVTVMLDEVVAIALVEHLLRNGKSRSQRRAISGSSKWIKPLGMRAGFAFEIMLFTSRVFWVGRRPVWYSFTEKPASPSHGHYFSFVRGTFNVSLHLKEALVQCSSYSRSGFKIMYHCGAGVSGIGSVMKAKETSGDYRDSALIARVNSLNWGTIIGWNQSDIGRDSSLRGFDGYSMTPDLAAVVQEIRQWIDMETWYFDRGIPWRRGYLFVGDPGTGKTAFVRSVAQDADIPVHVFDLASLSNQELRDCWGKMLLLNAGPRIALIEDIDGVFHGRTNVSANGGLTFDALLNCIDGVEVMNGVILIVSTNHPELVDDALANRPGRIDRIVTFCALDLEGRVKLARKIITDEATAIRFAEESGAMPAARFVEACRRVALGAVWGDDGPLRSMRST